MREPSESPEQSPQQAPKRPGFWSVVQSVLAAAFGVQSEEKRQKDFQHGRPGDYIAIGIVFVILFIVTLVLIVRSVLSSAGQ
ncbi:DUF2970 domain-containing protein [Permianibacter aggregans]|uniref:DUF2970 family protein n=1 Tax=Permianibacter aggregans TaxID=1510150 RepID=A0A4R6V031_9GAMM|nr:DUF2970 domain-containing protein [Permianibacter aggregans]QGX40509.1 DUF2970 domain-containing protein [Permianibacter aggregans]TDQ49344.1 DUF2970 family protein [Permianibacter aggregans]